MRKQLHDKWNIEKKQRQVLLYIFRLPPYSLYNRYYPFYSYYTSLSWQERKEIDTKRREEEKKKEEEDRKERNIKEDEKSKRDKAQQEVQRVRKEKEEDQAFLKEEEKEKQELKDAEEKLKKKMESKKKDNIEDDAIPISGEEPIAKNAANQLNLGSIKDRKERNSEDEVIKKYFELMRKQLNDEWNIKKKQRQVLL